MTFTSAILLAGGKGLRMHSSIPKQYLSLRGKTIACYSFDLLRNSPLINELIVVCDPSYQNRFDAPNVKFALPGERRQDSVENGFKITSPQADLILIHDAARPFIDAAIIQPLIEAGKEYGAGALAMPIKFTIKRADADHMVHETIDRSTHFEIQTPQILQRAVLQEGLDYAHAHHLSVTDDVSLAEAIGSPVKLVPGLAHNLKITTSEDLLIASSYLHAEIQA